MKQIFGWIWNDWLRHIYDWSARRRARRYARPSGPALFVDLYEQLVEELELLELNKKDREKLDRIKGRVEMYDEADASSVLQLELILVRYLKGAELRVRLLTQRELLYAMLTPEAVAVMRKALLKDLSADDELLKDETRALAVRVYRRFVMVPAVEAQRARQVKILLASMLWISLVFLALLNLDAGWLLAGPSSASVPLYLYVIAAYSGALGASVSVIRRLYQIEPRREPILIWLSIQHGGLSIAISPMFGAVFALLLIMIVNSGVIAGSLFPTFACQFWNPGYDNNTQENMGAVNGLVPARGLIDVMPRCTGSISQYAKLVLASFLAGWAERFVPDVLEKLTGSNGKLWNFAQGERDTSPAEDAEEKIPRKGVLSSGRKPRVPGGTPS